MIDTKLIEFLKEAETAGFAEPRLGFWVSATMDALSVRFQAYRNGQDVFINRMVPLIDITYAKFSTIELCLENMLAQLHSPGMP
jgi:hypothetical protein